MTSAASRIYYASKKFASYLLIALLLVGLIFISKPESASAVAISTIQVCPISLPGGVNKPQVDSYDINNYNSGTDTFAGTYTAFGNLRNILYRGPGTFNDSYKTGTDGAYPGVRLGAGPWNFDPIPPLTARGGQRLGESPTSPAYAKLENNCGSGASSELRASVRNSTNVFTGGLVERVGLRMSAPYGNVSSDSEVSAGRSGVGFSNITMNQSQRANLGYLTETYPGDGWQARSIVFNPQISTGTSFEGDKNYLGCFQYPETGDCDDGATVTEARNPIQKFQWKGHENNNAYYNQYYYVVDTGILGAYNGLAVHWQQDVRPNTNENPNIPRTDFVSELFCNMQSVNTREYCSTGASLNWTGISNFVGKITDTENPVTTLGINQQPIQNTGASWPDASMDSNQANWITNRATRNLGFTAADAGLGIKSLNISINGVSSINGVPLSEDWSSECTEWGANVADLGSTQYRLDRTFVVPRTGPRYSNSGNGNKAEQYTVNAPPICAAEKTYNRSVNLNAVPFSEGTNNFLATMADYTKPAGEGVSNTTNIPRTIKIDSKAPTVVLSSTLNSGARCYSSVNPATTSCDTVGGYAGNRYIKGSINFTGTGTEPDNGAIGASVSNKYSGVSLVNYNNWLRLNGYPIQCTSSITSYTYTTAGFTCNNINTASLYSGIDLQLQSNQTDNAGNFGFNIGPAYITDNSAPRDDSRILDPDTIELGGADLYNGSGLQYLQYKTSVNGFITNGSPGPLNVPGQEIWVRTIDNIGNVGAWKMYDLHAPDVKVFCESSNIANNDWYGAGKIPCWVEASNQDGASSPVKHTSMAYVNPEDDYSSRWVTVQTEAFVHGNEYTDGASRPFFSPAVFNSANMTGVGSTSSSSSYSGSRYDVIVQGPPSNDTNYMNWKNPWNSSNKEITFSGSTTNPKQIDGNESHPVENYIASAQAKQFNSTATNELGLRAVASSNSSELPTATSTPTKTLVGNNSAWQRIESKLTIPAHDVAIDFPWYEVSLQATSSGKPNAGAFATIANIDYLLFSKQFDIPADIQGVTNLNGRATNTVPLTSAPDSMNIKRDIAPPAQTAFSVSTSNQVGKTGGTDEDGKIHGYIRLQSSAEDLFIGNAGLNPAALTVDAATQNQLTTQRNAYNSLGASIRNEWQRKSSGLVSGGFVACSVELNGANFCDNTPTTDAQLERWFQLDQSNLLDPDVCSAEIPINSSDFDCLLDTNNLPFRNNNSYVIRFRAEDRAGNVSYSVPSNISVKNPFCLVRPNN